MSFSEALKQKHEPLLPAHNISEDSIDTSRFNDLRSLLKEICLEQARSAISVNELSVLVTDPMDIPRQSAMIYSLKSDTLHSHIELTPGTFVMYPNLEHALWQNTGVHFFVERPGDFSVNGFQWKPQRDTFVPFDIHVTGYEAAQWHQAWMATEGFGSLLIPNILDVNYQDDLKKIAASRGWKDVNSSLMNMLVEHSPMLTRTHQAFKMEIVNFKNLKTK